MPAKLLCLQWGVKVCRSGAWESSWRQGSGCAGRGWGSGSTWGLLGGLQAGKENQPEGEQGGSAAGNECSERQEWPRRRWQGAKMTSDRKSGQWDQMPRRHEIGWAGEAVAGVTLVGAATVVFVKERDLLETFYSWDTLLKTGFCSFFSGSYFHNTFSLL